jgi:hypothetical protein
MEAVKHTNMDEMLDNNLKHYWDDEEENQFFKNSFSGVNIQVTFGSMYGYHNKNEID